MGYATQDRLYLDCVGKAPRFGARRHDPIAVNDASAGDGPGEIEVCHLMAELVESRGGKPSGLGGSEGNFGGSYGHFGEKTLVDHEGLGGSDRPWILAFALEDCEMHRVDARLGVGVRRLPLRTAGAVSEVPQEGSAILRDAGKFDLQWCSAGARVHGETHLQPRDVADVAIGGLSAGGDSEQKGTHHHRNCPRHHEDPLPLTWPAGIYGCSQRSVLDRHEWLSKERLGVINPVSSGCGETAVHPLLARSHKPGVRQRPFDKS